MAQCGPVAFQIPSTFVAQPVTQERIVEVVEQSAQHKNEVVQEIVEREVEVIMYKPVTEVRERIVYRPVLGESIVIDRHIEKPLTIRCTRNVYVDQYIDRDINSIADIPEPIHDSDNVEIIEQDQYQINYALETIDVDVPVYTDLVEEIVEPVDMCMTIECKYDDVKGKWVAPIPVVKDVEVENQVSEEVVPVPVDRQVPSMSIPRTRQLLRDVEIEETVVTQKVILNRPRYVDAQGNDVLPRDANGNPIVYNRETQQSEVIEPNVLQIEVLETVQEEVLVEKKRRAPLPVRVTPALNADGTPAQINDALVSTTAGLVPFSVFLSQMHAYDTTPSNPAPVIPPHPEILKRQLAERKSCF